MKKRNETKLAVATKLRARRGKKKVWQKRPQLARCPFPGCEQLINTFMCPVHWPHVKRDTRRELVKAVRELKFHGGRRPGLEVVELFHQAIKEVATALHAQGVEHVEEARRPAPFRLARPPDLSLHEVIQAAAQPRGDAPAREGAQSAGLRVALPTREQVEEFGSGDGARRGPALPPRPQGR